MSEVQALVECPVIVGTAGHVDHGKSALIEALTGKNPDRLEVERRRGMTVELGFGELALPSGKIVGLVDVPGHAHYLRAMVQGATGIDVAVLVVSAVEGVMPQTREHVHVLELLGVTHMVVALTMCDLADSEMIELAELDVDDFLSDTVFAGAPIVPVSSKTGEGIDGLLAVLDEQVSACWDACRDRAERTDAAPRLPIDRCFTIKGVGTVVTGTLHDAPVAVGDELMALPSRTVCRVRGIQVHGDTPRALPGQRVALNLVGDGVAALDRGEMLGVADRFGQTLRFMMTFTYLGREGTKPRVGVVGEILVKFHPTANNHVVDVIEREGCEAVVPGLLDFFLYSMSNAELQKDELGSSATTRAGMQALIKLVDWMRTPVEEMLEKSRRFEAPERIGTMADKARTVLSVCNNMGEGWLLTAEMLDLIDHGAPNIICTQPFACLPNHVVGKAVIKELRRQHPESNIVAVDYDPGASEVNQLNRIKLMISVAKENMRAGKGFKLEKVAPLAMDEVTGQMRAHDGCVGCGPASEEAVASVAKRLGRGIKK